MNDNETRPGHGQMESGTMSENHEHQSQPQVHQDQHHEQQNQHQPPVDQQAAQQNQQVEVSAPKQEAEAPKLRRLPAKATKEDLERWLKEIDEKEAAKRAAEAKAKKARLAKQRERVRPARSKVVELLYAYYLVPPIDGDRSESKRIEALVSRLGLPNEPVRKPSFDLVEAVKLDMHVAATDEPEIGQHE